MKLIFVFTLLLFLNINVKSQEAKPQEQAAADTNQKWTRVGVDSLLENIRNYFDELLDVEVGWAALQARHISNVGYGIDNSIGLNRELRDTLEFLRNVVQSELFVKSMLKYDHFWPNLINRRKYSPTIRELENQHEDVYKKNLFFDVVFYPAWDTTKMDVDAARKSGKIEYTCEIKVNGLGSFKTELSEKEMSRVLNEALTSKEYKRIKGEAAPDVNQGLFAGMGWLIDKFGFKPFDDPVNIKWVDFYAPTAQSYGYDKYEDAVLAGNYDNISVKGKQYYVPWKSAAVTKTDTLIAVAVKKNPDRTSGDTLKFITTNGQPVKSVLQINDTTYKITLPPITSEGEFGLVATYSYVDTTGKDIVVNAGQANISGYTTQPMKLVIVPVNGNGKELSVTDIQQTINDIYKQAATTWSVEMYKGNLQVQNVYADDNKLDDGKTGFFSNYTDEMNDVIDAFKDQPDVDIDKKTCYLFMVNNAKSGSGKCGFMPLKRQFGFIFTDNCTNETGRTIAHELGHGPFRLYHTFSDENEYTRGEATTDNLMDYNNGSGLNKYQWDLIHDPESMIAWLQDEEEGAMFAVNTFPKSYFNSDGTLTFLSPSGNPIVLPEGVKEVKLFHGLPEYNFRYVVTGTLYKFTTNIGTYTLQVTDDGKTYKYANETGALYSEVANTASNTHHAIWGVPVSVASFVSYKIRISGSESGEKGTVKDEGEFPLDYYNGGLFVEKNRETISKAKEYYFGAQQQFVTSEEGVMIKNREYKPSLLPVLKLAQLRNMYPEIFKEFADFDRWDNYKNLSKSDLEKKEYHSIQTYTPANVTTPWETLVINEGLQGLSESNPKKFYQKFVNEFISFIDDKRNESLDFWQNLSKENTGKEVVRNTKYLSEDLCKTISNGIKKRAISIIIRDAKHRTSMDMIEGEEDAIVKLVRYTSEQYMQDMLTMLLEGSEYDTTTKILYALIKGVDDTELFFIGDDNYKKLIKTVVWLWHHSLYSLPKGKTNVTFNDVTLYEKLWSAIKTAGPLSIIPDVYVETNAFLNKNCKVVYQQKAYTGFRPIGVIDENELQPYHPIVLLNKANFSLLENYCNLSGMQLFPAILLPYADEKGDQKFTEDVIEASTDILGIATGAGTLATGCKIFARVVAISDVVASSVNFTNNLAEAPLGSKPLPKELNQFIQFVNLGTSSADLVANLPKLLKDLRKFEDIVLPTKSEAIESIDYFSKIKNIEAVEYLKHEDGRNYILYLEELKKEAAKTGLTDISEKIRKQEELWSTSIDDLASAIKEGNPSKYFGLLTNLGRKEHVPVSLVEAITKVPKTEELFKATTSIVGSVPDNFKGTVKVIDEVTKIKIHGVEFQVEGVRFFTNSAGETVMAAKGFCFPRNTIIQQKSGEKPIQDIVVGDSVLSYNHKSKTTVSNKVTKVFRRVTNSITKLVVGGTMLMATPEHHVYANGGYIEIQELQVGDTLVDVNGNYQFVESISTIDSTLTVYNFEVENAHNYYAGESRLLVHNSCRFVEVIEKLGNKSSKVDSYKETLDALELSVEARKAFHSKLLDNLDADEIIRLLDKIHDEKDFIKAFVRDADLVDIWKVFADSPDLIKNADDLEILGKYAKNNDLTPAKLKALFSGAEYKEEFIHFCSFENKLHGVRLRSEGRNDAAIFYVGSKDIKISRGQASALLKRSDKGWQSVVIHGDEGGKVFYVLDNDNKHFSVTPEELAAKLNSLNLGNIKLLSCHAGKGQGEALRRLYRKKGELKYPDTEQEVSIASTGEIKEAHSSFAIDNTPAAFNEPAFNKLKKVFPELEDIRSTYKSGSNPVIYNSINLEDATILSHYSENFRKLGELSAKYKERLSEALSKMPIDESLVRVTDKIGDKPAIAYCYQRKLDLLEITQEARSAFHARLAEKLDGEEIVKLFEDIQGDEDLVKAFLENEGFVDAWKVLDDAGENALKTNVTELQRVSDNLSEIKDAGGYKSWKATNNIGQNSLDEIGERLTKEGIDARFSDEIAEVIDDACDLDCAIDKFGCFVKGTTILTTEGEKEIQDVRAKDSVWSYNSLKNVVEKKLVKFTKTALVKALCIVHLSNGTAISTTPEHPFYVDGNYIEAKELPRTSLLKSYSGEPFFVDSVVHKDTLVRVYNFEVEDNHNYYVGKEQLLVHNENPSKPCLGKHLSKKEFSGVAAQVDGLSSTYKKKFLEQFEQEDNLEEILEAFNNNPSLIDDWKKACTHSDNGGYVYDHFYIGESGKSYSNTRSMQKGYEGEQYGKAELFSYKVPYMTDLELDACEVFVRNGKLYNHEGELIRTTGSTAIFVMDKSGGVFIKNLPENGNYHHSSFLSGDDVTSAGHIVIQNGEIKAINAITGHYKIPKKYNKQLLKELERRGILVKRIKNFGLDPINMTKLK